MKTRKLTCYLAGAMEAAENLGSGWRDKITPFLKTLNLDVLNPCEFEPQQLKGLRPNRLPDYFMDGTKKVYLTHWHELKNASEPQLYNRFLKYMRRIINYDIGLVENNTDLVIVLWDKAASKGAGTHAELTAAFRHNIPVYCVATSDIPAWAKACCTDIFLTFEALQEKLKEDFGE